jgi:hypothetical protein
MGDGNSHLPRTPPPCPRADLRQVKDFRGGVEGEEHGASVSGACGWMGEPLEDQGVEPLPHNLT